MKTTKSCFISQDKHSLLKNLPDLVLQGLFFYVRIEQLFLPEKNCDKTVYDVYSQIIDVMAA